MKKSIWLCIPLRAGLTTVFAFIVLFANAQLKVFTTGNVSVKSTNAPAYNGLGVTGDIDAVASGNSYRIQGYKVLWYNSTSNIFVGVGAGASNNSGLTYNTFMGYNAGNANTSSVCNSAFGNGALALGHL